MVFMARESRTDGLGRRSERMICFIAVTMSLWRLVPEGMGVKEIASSIELHRWSW
jgi:hypothetical protein